MTSSLGEQSLASWVKPTMSAYRILEERNITMKFEHIHNASIYTQKETMSIHLCSSVMPCVLFRSYQHLVNNEDHDNAPGIKYDMKTWYFLTDKDYLNILLNSLGKQLGDHRACKALHVMSSKFGQNSCCMSLCCHVNPLCLIMTITASELGWSFSQKKHLTHLPLTSSRPDQWLIKRPVWFNAESYFIKAASQQIT